LADEPDIAAKREWLGERRVQADVREHHADEFLLVTQNVDDLHRRAGLTTDRIVQIHEDIFVIVTKCSRCDFGFTERMEEQQEIPKCTRCTALMRPGVVWFGEQLPRNAQPLGQPGWHRLRDVV
jgi:NAD-dependent SIR2 family protein deacetylase